MSRPLVVLAFLLLVAAGLSMRTPDDHGGLEPTPLVANPHFSPQSRDQRSASLRSPRTTPSRSDQHIPILDSLTVEPLIDSHPVLEAKAQRVQAGALQRLEELTDELGLTEQQQLGIFPLLARAHPDYSRDLHLVGIPLTSDLAPLGKIAADQRIHKLLTADQLLDLEILSASADVWWTDVIARLEKDLRESTKDPLPPEDPPDHDPSPPDENPPPRPSAPLPSGTRPGNLFDLLERNAP